MAVLTDIDRFAEWAKFMSNISSLQEKLGAVNKQDLRDAIDAADDWFEAHITSFYAAMPQPAKSELIDKQKDRMLLQVIQRRFGL